MKSFKKLLCLMLIVCFAFSIVACSTSVKTDDPEVKVDADEPAEDNTTNETEEPAPAGFEVTVTDNEGNAVAGVVLQVCMDTCMPAVTDADGVAVFNTEITASHKLSVLTLPEGYEYNGEAEIYLEDGMTEFAVTVDKVA